MPRPNPPHLVSERTRHGKRVWYVRRGHEPRIRLYPAYDSPAFWTAYRSALDGQQVPKPSGLRGTGTLGWLIAKYTASSAFKSLKKQTRANRNSAYRALVEALGHEPLADFDKASVVASRERRAETPHAANSFVYAVRALFQWAVLHGHSPADPTEGIKPLKGNNDTGYHAWTDAEVSRFHEVFPRGTRQRVAIDVMLFTGLRRGDAARIGGGHVRQTDAGPEFEIRTEKTGMLVIAPLLPALIETLQAGPLGETTWIAKPDGEPFVKTSFGLWFKRACEKAGVPGTAHGLRKAGARRAAEDGATESQLNALYGWADGSRESAVYTRTASRARMAREARKRQVDPAP